MDYGEVHVATTHDAITADLVDVTALDLAELPLFTGPRWTAARRAILAWVDEPTVGIRGYNPPPPPPVLGRRGDHRAETP
jgi:hypothetical protein